jgi:hypothetical protein
MIMFKERKTIVIVWLVTALYVATLMAGLASAQKTPPRPQDKVAIGENEVKQLLLLMDTDKNGKISKKEYMDFMEKEFARLDKDKSGELDVKELTQSQIRTSPPAIGK